ANACRCCRRARRERGAAHGAPERDRREQRRRAAGEELQVRVEGAPRLRKIAMLALRTPRPDSWEHGALQGHPAVSSFGRIEVHHPFVLHGDPVRGEGRLAGDEHHAIAEYFEALHLTVELRAELRRAVENGLRGDAPRVRVELETEVVPETSLAKTPKI